MFDRSRIAAAVASTLAALALVPVLLAGCVGFLAGCGGDSDPAADSGDPSGSRGASLEAPPVEFGPVGERRDEARPQSDPGGLGPAAGDGAGTDGLPLQQDLPQELPESGDLYDTALTARVESAVATALERARTASRGRLDPSQVAVSVVAIDAGTGRVLVRRLSELQLVPASNLKLLTVAAALMTMGPDGAFVTRFETEAPVRDGVLEGDLVVRAGGDPLHRREGDGSLDAWIDPIAESLRAAGIRRVRGAIVLDEGGWIAPGPGPEWPAPAQHWKDYCAFSGGFSANGGCFRASVTPTGAGQAATVVLRPRHHGLVRKGTVTTAGNRVAVNVGANRGGVTVRGKIRADASTFVAEFSHPDPVDLFGHALIGGLLDRGLQFDGGFARARGVTLRSPRTIHEMRTPIGSVLEAILLDSNNPVADQLFLATGAHASGEGTREAGARAVAEAVGALGVDTRTLVQVDGSGLSKANRTSAEQLAALVAAVVHRGGAMRRAILDALPVAGERGGLSGRMRGTVAEGRVRAKTGWVQGASGLSGVAETVDGHEVVFSILVGYPRIDGLNTKAWKPMQDEMCVAFAGWSPGPASEGSGGGR